MRSNEFLYQNTLRPFTYLQLNNLNILNFRKNDQKVLEHLDSVNNILKYKKLFYSSSNSPNCNKI